MAIKVNDQWIVNNDHGILIYAPNLLISTTSVVGMSLYKYLLAIYLLSWDN